jgi:hypothetical protein
MDKRCYFNTFLQAIPLQQSEYCSMQYEKRKYFITSSFVRGTVVKKDHIT